jgi:hypothetical protein
MDDVARVEESGGQISRSEECVHLLGLPSMREFMEFARARSVGGRDTDQVLLVREWRAAADRIRELELTEGEHPRAGLLPLPAEMSDLAVHESREACIEKSYGILPYRWSLVELDELIVHQRSVDLAFVRRIRGTFPSQATEQDLFRFAAGHLQPAPEVRVTRSSENVYTFSSVSSDLRFLDLALLDPKAVQGHNAPGRAAHVIGVFVGFGLNHICALRMQDRLILINGTHRAYVLHELGIRAVPCLVRDVSRDDDLDLIGATDVKQNLQLYLRARRPPRLRDFFDSRLRMIIPVEAASRLVHVQLNTQRSRVSTG